MQITITYKSAYWLFLGLESKINEIMMWLTWSSRDRSINTAGPCILWIVLFDNVKKQGKLTLAKLLKMALNVEDVENCFNNQPNQPVKSGSGVKSGRDFIIDSPNTRNLHYRLFVCFFREVGILIFANSVNTWLILYFHRWLKKSNSSQGQF